MGQSQPASTKLASIVLWVTLLAFGVGRAALCVGWPGMAAWAFAAAWLVGCGGLPLVVVGVIDGLMAERRAGAESGQ